MSTVATATKTIGTAVLATQLVQTGTAAAGAGIVVGGAIGCTTAFSGVLNFKMGRTAVASLTGAPVFRIEGQALASTGEWMPIYIWSSGNFGTPATMQTVTVANVPGGVSIVVGVSLRLCHSTPICIYNSAVAANSEWNWVKVDSLTMVMLNSITAVQTATVSQLTTQAEMWAIPVDLTPWANIRVVVDNVWNLVTSPIIVKADLNTLDSVLNT